MKRFWQTWLAVAVTTVAVGSVEAQSNWDQSAEIGSYQSILARAGYGHQVVPPSQNAVPTPPSQAASVVASEQPMQGCVGACGGVCNGGCGNVSVGQCGRGGLFARSGSCGGGCDAGGVYGCTSGLAGRLGGRADDSSSNYVVGIRGLFMRRDHEDDARITRNGAGDVLLSTGADMGLMGGVDFSMTKRGCDGSGIEFRYWGLYPGEQSAQLTGPGLNTYLTGFNDLSVAPGAQNLMDYYNNADSNDIYRENVIHNIELNFLRNGGEYTTRSGHAGNFELLGGFRWFQFNETFRYTASNAAGNPTLVDYEIEVENALLGFQLGGRSEVGLSDRWSLATVAKLGLFNNHIEHQQNILDNNGVFAYNTAVGAGAGDYNLSSDKNDLSMLGELDLGLVYRINSCTRATFGYRAVGISGIALAPDQIPNDFTNINEILSINSNGNLLLGGGYAGLEYCY